MNSNEKTLHINKSQALRGLRCALGLWHEFYNTEEWRKEEDASYKLFSSIQIGEIQKLARKRFPGGVYAYKLESDLDLHTLNTPIYNLQLTFHSFQTQIDIIVPTEFGWEIYIVKPISKIKKDNLMEMAYHSFLAEKSGWKISKANILAIDSNYDYTDTLDLEQYFKIIDLTDKIISQKQSLEPKLLELESDMKKDISTISSVRKCKTPKDCRNTKICWKEITDFSLYDLRESGHIMQSIFDSGVDSLERIPESIELNFPQKVQIQCSIHKKPHIDKKSISEFIEKFRYPLHFLDFETINPALPVYPKTKPFQHIPFLYYLFRQITPESPIEEFYYYDDFETDPRKSILERLSTEILPNGSLICYNDLIERRCIVESVQLHKEYESWYASIQDSFLDISKPFRNFWYYHPDQKGSASLKSVLSPLTGLSYSNLEIKEGGTANLEFLKLKLDSPDATNRFDILEKIKLYCRMDSLAMVKILEKLKEIDSSVAFLLVEKP